MDNTPSKFINWFKQRSNANVDQKTKKRELLRENSRNNRRGTFMDRRGIQDLVSSPEIDEPKIEKNPRLVALKAWRERRNKEKLEKQANKKPVFKVQHISIDIGGPKLEFINKTIKGKRFDIKPNRTKKTQNAIVMGFEVTNLNEEDGAFGITSRLRSKTKPVSGVERNLKSTNSKNAKIAKEKAETKRKVENVPVEKPNDVLNKNKKNLFTVNNEYCTPSKEKNVKLTNPYKSPEQQKLAAGYVSPFVTISRGKSSARKEYKMRSSQGGSFDVSDELAVVTGNKAGAAYFHGLLNSEIERIEKLCNDWIKYKDEEQSPEEVCGMINSAVGHSKLLMNKKFQQFRGLIIKCEMNNSVPPVTCTDLHGFWEMVCLEVDNINKRFEYLNKLCENNWEEVLPVVNKPKPKKKGTKKASKLKPESSLKDLIKEKRLKFKEKALADENVPPTSSSRITRASLACSKNYFVTNDDSSPGLSCISARKQCRVTISTDSVTPAKGILKTPNTKSKKKKLVLFRANAIDLESPPMAMVKPRRSSKRISQMLQDGMME